MFVFLNICVFFTERNGCSAAGDAQQCAEMCVPLPDLQYQCVCPDYQRLDASGTNCVDDGASCLLTMLTMLVIAL